MTKKRTSWDFSESEHRVETFKSKEGNEVRIDHLQKGKSNCGYVRFVNDDYGMTVYGDFGNWVFNRPFIPSVEGYVSDYYWEEKLRTSSSQDHGKFDSEATEKEIMSLINGGLVEQGFEGKELEKVSEWLNDLLMYVDEELDYTYHLYRDTPCEFDLEYAPFCKQGSYQLEIVFDAFDEICKRLKEKAKYGELKR